MSQMAHIQLRKRCSVKNRNWCVSTRKSKYSDRKNHRYLDISRDGNEYSKSTNVRKYFELDSNGILVSNDGEAGVDKRLGPVIGDNFGNIGLYMICILILVSNFL